MLTVLRVDWFTSSEAVHGLVGCNGLSNLTKIVVYLEGQLRISTRTQGSLKKADLGGVSHALFVRENTLYSARDSSPAASLDAIPFTLTFPENGEANAKSKDCAQCNQALPPSFHFASEAFHASVNYRVRVVAERSGILNPDNSVVQNVEFRPMLPTRPLLIDQPWKVTKQLEGEVLGVKENASADTPSVACEFTFPAAKTLRPGSHIDIGVNFVIPVELQRLWKRIWIYQLVVRLRTKTTAAIGGSGKSTTGYTDACNIRGLYPLELPAEYPRVVVSPQLWQPHIYPFIAPSLRMCKLQRTHALEIHIKFASKTAKRTQSVEAQFDVIVESGAIHTQEASDAPPAYE